MATMTAPAEIGKPMSRIDGPLKVSGRAAYTSDFQFPGLLHAVPVGATVGKGKLTSLDTSAAEKMPGVRAVYHRKNIGTIYRSHGKGFEAKVDERRPPFDDDEIRYYGQYIAVAVADSMEQARAAAEAVKATYAAEVADVETKLTIDGKPKDVSRRGDAEAAFAAASVKVDQTYVVPAETHNPIELHATTAVWDGDHLTLYECSQAIFNMRDVLSQMMGIPTENVRVITKFLGSGFGGKLWPWTHVPLAAAAARNLGRPVKLVVSRKDAFRTVGHRPLVQQRVRMAASADGKLNCLIQDYVNHTAILDDYEEECGEATPFFYSTPNLTVTGGLCKRNVGSPTAMRGPGAVPGLFATESAYDELAIALNIDPVKLRTMNEPEKDEEKNIPFSSRHYLECLTAGAEKFGWSKRTPGVGSMKRDGLTLGWGVAGCSWIAARFPASVTVDLQDDGTVTVMTGTQDIGTGTYTVLAMVTAQQLGIPVDRVKVILGDTRLPNGPISGGSMVTASVIPAVSAAVKEAVDNVIAAAVKTPNSPLLKMDPKTLAMTNGKVHPKDAPAESGEPFDAILRAGKLRSIRGKGSSEGTFGAKPEKSFHSYGAHFVEVTWQPEIARLRISRVVTVIDAGKVLNPLAGRNQIEGAVVMGIGMALFEETQYLPGSGAPINSNLADYVVSTHADAPPHEVIFLDHPDFGLNEIGARGIGEIGLAGTAAAIANAVHHATGVRVRELPIKVEDLIGHG